MKKYKVCIECKTYNQENVISRALDGLVMQKTNFPFIAIVIDDASTDHTPEIVKNYESKYPDKIKAICLKENRWQKGLSHRPVWLEFEYETEYVTYCDGDDYWIDENKIQREVDLLDAHPEYSMVCSSRFVKDPEGKMYEDVFHGELFKTADFLEGVYLHSQVMLHRSNPDFILRMFKKYDMDYEKMGGFNEMMMGYFYSLLGDVATLPNIVAVYVMDGGGVWSKYSENEKRYYELIDLYDNHKLLKFEYRDIFAKAFFKKSWDNVWYPVKHHNADKTTWKIFVNMFKCLSLKEFSVEMGHWLKKKLKR